MIKKESKKKRKNHQDSKSICKNKRNDELLAGNNSNELSETTVATSNGYCES